MSYLRFKPQNPILKPFIEYFNSFTGNDNEDLRFISLPEGKIGFVFMLAGSTTGINAQVKTNRTESHISGLIQEPTYYKLSNSIETFTVVFKPGTLYHFIPHHPIDELAKSSTSLKDVFGEQINRVEDQLVNTSCALERVAIIERFLLTNMQDTDARIKSVVDLVTESINNINVSDLSAHVNVGNRQLRNIFRKKLGLSPKQFIRLFRFKTALSNLPCHDESNSQFAPSLGYYDESHFIHDFKSFSGMTPKQYLNNQNFISDFSNFNRLMLR